MAAEIGFDGHRNQDDAEGWKRERKRGWDGKDGGKASMEQRSAEGPAGFDQGKKKTSRKIISPSLPTSHRSICGKAVTVSTANVYLKLFGERVRTWKCRSELWIGVNCCDDSTLVGQKNAKS